jgi:hypothetical protein
MKGLIFSFREYVEDVEMRRLLGLDVSKGSGLNGIPPRILKSCSGGFKRPLTLLFNRSLSERVFPECNVFTQFMHSVLKNTELCREERI